MGKTLSYEKIAKNWQDPDPQYDYLFKIPSGKYNTAVPVNGNEKILCKEPYAADAYELYSGYKRVYKSKDIPLYSICDVKAVAFLHSDKLVKCEETESGVDVYVPMSEVRGDIRESIVNGEPFKVMIIKNDGGYNYASRKKCEHVIDLSILREYLQNGTDFNVTITTLVRGGFIAKFNDTVDCFLPGAHAAANVIYDFESYLGKTVRVCVDNYDTLSNMFIVSHKKYIKKILPERVHDIEYGKEYTGVLTSNPTKYGIFVEFAVNPEYGNIFTGLIKSSNNPQIQNLKQGDEIQFYVSNVSVWDRGVKINLVTSLDEVLPENLEWQAKKNATIGNVYEYVYVDGTISVVDKNQDPIFSMAVDGEKIKDQLVKYTKVCVTDVDVIDKNVSLVFAE